MTYLLFTLLALVLTSLYLRRRFSFAAQRSTDYAATGPAFDIRTHLNGPIDCEGLIYGPTGRVTSRFLARMNGSWTGATGVLTEEFTYSTGTRQNRAWHLRAGNDGTFTATADDIIGTAKGEQSGATVRMDYRLRLPEDAGGHVLSVTDWMYLMDNGVILNRSEMRKFGIKVAELQAVMRPAAG